MNNVVSILKGVGAIITDSHLVYVSGKHGSVYVNKDALYPHTAETSKVCEMFAKKTKDLDIDIVVAPALGGIILSQWTAHHLSQLKGKEILGVYSEKTEDNNQILKRGYEKLVNGKNILVLEDVTNTGGSVLKLVEEVKSKGGNVVQVYVMVNRDPDHVTTELIGAPFAALGELPAEAFAESECPLCAQNIPINTSVGHGKKYLDSKQK
jgi:orotate phosphoribosyltransferase